MDEKIIPKNIDNDELNLNSEENDYKNLINRLKQIRLNIELLTKIISR
tara:strand:- start:519 stop:662 length:144 start_codon:yes stop_codon:yes gene_type:complete